MAAKFSSAAAARGATGSHSDAPEPGSRAGGRLRTADFDAVYRQGLRRTAAHFLVLAQRNGRPARRFGISVRSSLGGAVVRNRIKRRVRALWQRAQKYVPPGWDIVVHARSSEVVTAKFSLLETELTRLLRSLPAGQP